MGLCNSPNISQEHKFKLFSDLEDVQAYINDLLVTLCLTFKEHLKHLDKVFSQLSEAGLKVNANKSYFAKFEIEYLGNWITQGGIQPLPKRVEALQNIAPPKNKKQLQRFLRMVNYYCNMWTSRSEVLTPLTHLTSANVKFKWTSNVEQMALNKIQQIVKCEMLLSYPDFNQPFKIHTDASHTKLGVVISQKNKPIAFYSRKLQPAQRQYTTTECELLSIIETLKEFKNILLLGQQIVVYMHRPQKSHL